ncbi:MAG: hypothetical protein AAF394_03145 [Planctomycetota bacterium]
MVIYEKNIANHQLDILNYYENFVHLSVNWPAADWERGLRPWRAVMRERVTLPESWLAANSELGWMMDCEH